jgi:hypothetical protein
MGNWWAKLKKMEAVVRFAYCSSCYLFYAPIFISTKLWASNLYFNLGHDDCMRIKHII